VAAVRRDYDGIADALYAIGTPTKRVDRNAFRAEVSLLADRYLGKQLKDIELSALMRDLVQGATKYGVEIPTDFVLVGKALMTIEGVGREIDPELDVFEEAKPLFVDIVKKRYSPERLGLELLRRLERLGGLTTDVPEQVRDVLEDLRLGRLTVRTSDLDASHAADRLGRRLYSGLVAAALLLSGAWVLSSGHREVGGALMAVAALWLAAHALRDVVRGAKR
jgi:ubiquinone biosynthesis protein